MVRDHQSRLSSCRPRAEQSSGRCKRQRSPPARHQPRRFGVHVRGQRRRIRWPGRCCGDRGDRSLAGQRGARSVERRLLAGNKSPAEQSVHRCGLPERNRRFRAGSQQCRDVRDPRSALERARNICRKSTAADGGPRSFPGILVFGGDHVQRLSGRHFRSLQRALCEQLGVLAERVQRIDFGRHVVDRRHDATRQRRAGDRRHSTHHAGWPFLCVRSQPMAGLCADRPDRRSCATRGELSQLLRSARYEHGGPMPSGDDLDRIAAVAGRVDGGEIGARGDRRARRIRLRHDVHHSLHDVCRRRWHLLSRLGVESVQLRLLPRAHLRLHRNADRLWKRLEIPPGRAEREAWHPRFQRRRLQRYRMARRQRRSSRCGS